MKKYIYSIMAFVCLGFCFNAYGDQYIQNLHSQAISHYEALGYKFINVGDGWHTIKPMETLCFEIVTPVNPASDPNFVVYGQSKGDFRQEVAYIDTAYIDYKYINKSGRGYEETLANRMEAPSLVTQREGMKNKEMKNCIQNVSRKSNLYIKYELPIMPLWPSS